LFGQVARWSLAPTARHGRLQQVKDAERLLQFLEGLLCLACKHFHLALGTEDTNGSIMVFLVDFKFPNEGFPTGDT